MNYLSLFSGIGAPESALKNIGIDYNLVGFSKIDKYAVKSYCTVHEVDESLNLGDITKIDIDKLPKNVDLITHGSPCQSFSIAGKQHGGDEGSGTRSSLMWNTVEIVKHIKPKVVMWENVKNVLSKKHIHNYKKYLNSLSELGYNNYAKVLNSKNYGIPQNRERIFVISIRKDVDKGFNFPEPIELKLRLKDMLEDEVDEKYYLSDEIVERFVKSLNCSKFPFGKSYKVLSSTVEHGGSKGTNSRHWVYDINSNISILSSTDYKQPKQILINQIGMIDMKGNEQIRRVYGVDGLSPTLSTMQGGNTQPKILLPCIVASRGRNLLKPSDRTPGVHVGQRLEPNTKGLCNTLTSVQKDNYVLENNFRIRKLTPLECWRLMGFSDVDFEKAAKVCSNSQLYKQAGNSIVVNVLVHIFNNLKFLFR